jgi:hypothetical protein
MKRRILVPKRPHDANVGMKNGSTLWRYVSTKAKKSEATDNPYEQFTPWDQDPGDSPGDRKGIKMHEQVTTQSLGNRIPKGINPMERLELTRRRPYWGICQYNQNYP